MQHRLPPTPQLCCGVTIYYNGSANMFWFVELASTWKMRFTDVMIVVNFVPEVVCVTVDVDEPLHGHVPVGRDPCSPVRYRTDDDAMLD